MNSLRAMLAEFGVVAAQGYRGLAALRAHLADEASGLPETLAAALRCLAAQLDALTPSIEALEEKIRQIAKADAAMRRLSAIPGIGFITAHAVVAAIGEGRQFARGRDFAAWAGMTPRQHSSAGKRRAPGPEPAGGKPAAQAVRARRHDPDAQRPLARGPRHEMAAQRAVPPADEGGRHGAGRQDRKDRLGGARLRPGLRASPRSDSVKGRARGRRSSSFLRAIEGKLRKEP